MNSARPFRPRRVPLTITDQGAFTRAIAQGRLSANPASAIYAGHYMFMGYHGPAVGDTFKHIDTRQYLP